MKLKYFFFFMLTLFSSQLFSQLTQLWERSITLGNKPTWFGTDTERGFAYGYVGGNDRLYVVSRSNGVMVKILDAQTGNDVGDLITTGISGGTFALNDIEVSDDGTIFGCNLTTDANTSAFKVYKWTSETANPVEVLSFTTSTTVRLGDKFTVVGSASDNSLTMYAASSSNNKVYKFTTTDNGNSFTASEITLQGVSTNPGSTPAVWVLPDGTFWVNGQGINPRRFNPDGTVIDTIPGSIIPTNSNAMRSLSAGGRTLVAVFVSGITNHNLRFVDVSNVGSYNASFEAMTSLLGGSSNLNATGDVDIKNVGNGVFDVYLLVTNNGIAAYRYYLDSIPVTTINSFPYTQNFDSGIFPSEGWSTNFWQRTTTEAKSGKGARIIYNYSSVKQGILLSPKFELPPNSRIKFWWKDDDINTLISGQDTTFFEISTDSGNSWISLDTLSAPSYQTAYQERIHNLNSYAGNNVYFRWRDKTNSTFSAYGTGLDEIVVEVIPTTPIFSVLPASKDFGTIPIGDVSTAQVFEVTNAGIDTLVIYSTTLTGSNANQFVLTDTNVYPIRLAENQKAYFSVSFAPTTAGNLSANLTFNASHRNVNHDVPLTGVGFALTTPFTENFEGTFPPNSWTRKQGLLTDTVTFTSSTSNWVQDDFGNITSPVNKSAKLNIYGTTRKDWLISPPIILPALTDPNTMYKLEFDVALTSWNQTYQDTLGSDDKFAVVLSTDNGTTWLAANVLRMWVDTTLINDSTGDHISIILPVSGGGIVRIGFYGESTVSNKDNDLFVDNVSINTYSIGWANLQFPPSGTITVGESLRVYAQVWADGVTNSPGPGTGMKAWIGWNSSNTNPATWTNWVEAVYNVDVGNNDEFMADIGATLPPGTYYYASRFQLGYGPYKYGGYSSGGGGFWDDTNYVSGVLTVNPATGPLSGDYYIPQGSYPKGFPTLDSAFKAINSLGQSGDVRFLIDADLNEVGANLVLTKTDTVHLLTIKPAPTKTPTIYITGCTSTTGANQYTGITLNGAKNVLFDGSNTDGGTTRDLTIAMNDSLYGRIAIQLYANADFITLRNLVIKYLTMDPALITTRGVYVNGQASGVTDYFSVENCKIGDDTYQPAYAVSVTGWSGTGTYASNIFINKNRLYGHMRTVYFFYGGVFAEIMDNEIKGTIPPPSGNVRWGILFNNYKGQIQIANNKIQTLRMASTGTQGIYGIGTLSGAAGTVLTIYNNFLGGDYTHSGTGTPASVDVISFQDNIPNAKVYHNTIVLNDIGKLASSRMTGVRWGGSANVELKNNIIVNNVNASVAYCLYRGGGTFTSNNNAFYVSGANGNLGYFNGAVQTLQAWKDSTGQDSASFVENPPFVGGLDFHIQPNLITQLESGGTPVPVGIDIDGETRDPYTPDIGADEFVGFNPNNLPDTVDIAYRRLWNIVSVPLNASDMTVAALFPNATSNAFWFDGGGYVVRDTLEVGKGYWLKFNVDSLTTVTGPRKDSLVVNVNEGWNLIGTLSVDIPKTNVSSNPSGIIVSNFFGFSNKYYPSDVLKKGQGYWVKTSAAGTLTLRKTVLAKSGDELYVESIDPKWRKIVITDDAGVSEELYLADQVDELRYSLPPLPPSSVFDVRFDSDRYVEVDNYTHRINLQGVKYPVTLKITNAEKGFYRVKDAIDGSYLNVVLKNGEPIKITDPNIQAILIEGATIPTQFDLMQNYPNPFNPTTTIRYAIAEPVKVKLIVYNAVGQKVKELVNSEQEAGYYTVEFNASNLASGVYLIRLETPKFSKTIKSLLIK